jgi:hypothetical protein
MTVIDRIFTMRIPSLLATNLLILVAGASLRAADPLHPLVRVDNDDELLGGMTPVLVDDVRLGYGLLPLSARISTDAGQKAGYVRHGDLSSGVRMSALWMLPVGTIDDDGDGMLGLELSRNAYHQDQTAADPLIDYRSYALTLHADIGWRMGRFLHAEIGPFAGAGISSMNPGPDYGPYWEYGGRIACYVTIAHHLQFGIDARYEGTYGRQSFPYGTMQERVVIKTSGPSGMAQVGYRF